MLVKERNRLCACNHREKLVERTLESLNHTKLMSAVTHTRLLKKTEHLLIMTPDTASSSTAMRAEVPTDNPSARWERDGWGASEVTAKRQGETTVFVLTSPEEH